MLLGPDEVRDLPFRFEGRREDQTEIGLQGGRELHPFFLSVRSLPSSGKVEGVVRISFLTSRERRSLLVDCERSFLLSHELGGSSLLLSVGCGSSVLSCSEWEPFIPLHVQCQE